MEIDDSVEAVSVKWFGDSAIELAYKMPATGEVKTRLLYRDDEPELEIVERELPWSFDGDGDLFRLVSEAQRVRLAHLFDPVLAVHTSIVDPLAPPDNSCVRCDAAPTAAPVSAGR